LKRGASAMTSGGQSGRLALSAFTKSDADDVKNSDACEKDETAWCDCG
jgi:hypothetical protein